MTFFETLEICTKKTYVLVNFATEEERVKCAPQVFDNILRKTVTYFYISRQENHL